MTEKTFPILCSGYRNREEFTALRAADVLFYVVGIPWEMIRPHEAQAQNNHSQSLNRLAERGGLGADEALAVLGDRRWRSMSVAQAHADLAQMVSEWKASQPKAA